MLSVEDFITAGTLVDPVTQTMAPNVKRVVSHLTVWVQRAERIVNSAALAVEVFIAADARAAEMLANIKPRDVEPVLPGLRLPPLPPAEDTSASSFVQFDPRDAEPVPEDPVVVERLAAGEGVRVGPREKKKGGRR